MADQSLRRRERESIGHIPMFGVCRACGLVSEGLTPHEPCADQVKAREMIEDGYMSLPASPEEFARLVKAATDG